MDVETYALLKGKCSQGSFASTSDLPTNVKEGATAVVNGDLYYYTNGQWRSVAAGASAITNAFIDSLFG